jgi:hypothetical protein
MASTHTPLASHYVLVHMYMCGEWTPRNPTTMMGGAYNAALHINPINVGRYPSSLLALKPEVIDKCCHSFIWMYGFMDGDMEQEVVSIALTNDGDSYRKCVFKFYFAISLKIDNKR